MSGALRDDVLYRTRQAWIRTGLGAAAVGALAVRAALLGNVNAPAMVAALLGAVTLIGVAVHRGRQARAGGDVRRLQAWMVMVGIVLLGLSGILLALTPT